MKGRAWVSVFVVAILVLQLVPVAREFTGARETLWPFLAWGMYRHSSGTPVQATVHRVLAVTAKETRVLRGRDAGFDQIAFRRYYQVPIASGDSAAARDLAQRLARRGAYVGAIIGEETQLTVTEGGIRSRSHVHRYTVGRP